VKANGAATVSYPTSVLNFSLVTGYYYIVIFGISVV